MARIWTCLGSCGTALMHCDLGLRRALASHRLTVDHDGKITQLTAATTALTNRGRHFRHLVRRLTAHVDHPLEPGDELIDVYGQARQKLMHRTGEIPS